MQNYRKALQDARKELQDLLKERGVIDARITRLKQTIDGLAALCDDTDYSECTVPISLIEMPEPPGVTDGIRMTLLSSRASLSAPQIRNELVARGLVMSEYVNDLAVVHNTLRRLEKQKEVERDGELWKLTQERRNVMNQEVITRLALKKS